MNKKIEYILRCVKNINDDTFVNTVMEYRRGYHLIRFESKRDYEKDCNAYHIHLGNSVDGFFSFFRETLDALYYADKMGFIPVIEYDKSIQYSEKDKVFDTENPFEYYFKQPCNLSIQDLEKISRVFCYDRPQRNYAQEIGNNFSYKVSEQYLQALAIIARKYIKLRNEVDVRLNQDLRNIELERARVLGIHFRGTDFKQGYKYHPTMILVDDYVDAIKKVIDINNYEKIFIATDDLIALEHFEKIFGQKMISYNDVIRGNTQTSVMFSESTRPLHHFELGYEVLRDVWTLANCDGLIAGMSQVSICARIMSRSFGKEYLDEIILNKGINEGNKIYKGKLN